MYRLSAGAVHNSPSRPLSLWFYVPPIQSPFKNKLLVTRRAMLIGRRLSGEASSLAVFIRNVQCTIVFAILIIKIAGSLSLIAGRVVPRTYSVYVYTLLQTSDSRYRVIMQRSVLEEEKKERKTLQPHVCSAIAAYLRVENEKRPSRGNYVL